MRYEIFSLQRNIEFQNPQFDKRKDGDDLLQLHEIQADIRMCTHSLLKLLLTWKFCAKVQDSTLQSIKHALERESVATKVYTPTR
jgi:hypothetical protein